MIMKILRNLFLLIFSFFITNTVSAQIYVTNPADCPNEYMSQTCTDPPNVCGLDGTTVLCYDTATIQPKSTNSSVSSGDHNASGGFHLNCIASKDTASPFCDQNGALSCLQKSTCRTQNRITTCLAGTWGQSECSNCKSGYNDCSGDAACETQNGTNCEIGGLPGTWSGCTCVTKILKLGPDSVGTTYLNQSSSFTKMSIDGTGVFIGSSTSSVSFNVFGATTLSNDLSMAHNKSIQLNDASTSTVLLIGNYGDSHGFGYGTSTPRTASLAIEGDVKANRLCIKEDCRAEWTDIQGVNYWTLNGTNIYNNTAGNVGIGDDVPSNKLSVIGNIAGSGSLRITGTATSSNYFVSDLGIGSFPSGYWNRLVDLSGSGNSAYISRTSNTHAIMAASDTGTPVGTGYDFIYRDHQMVLGTITKHPLNFIIGGKSRMFLSDDGKLGIGTTTPTATLDVNGGVRIGTINNDTGDIVTVSSLGVIQKRTTEETRVDIGAAKEINSLYYVEGNTTGTAGTWTGNIDGLDAYYDGLTITYKIGIAGASATTLNINNLGANTVRRNTGALTSTHLPVGTVVVLTYTTISSTGYWVWADYGSTAESYYYLRWVGPNVIAGEQITRYKIIMEGHDGRFYPITTGNSTAVNGKTISSAKFKMNGQILWYNTTTVINEDSLITSTNLYSDYYHATRANYTFNKLSDWTAGKAVYLVGTIDNDGYFVLDGAGSIGTDFMSQDLLTEDNGKVYILLGYMSNDTYGFKLTPDRVAYHFKDGKIRLYESMSGTGSANYITKWASSTALGNSQIYDNSTYVGIGTTTPEAKLDVNGSLSVSGAVSLTGPLYTTEGNRLLMVDNAGSVTATTTLSGVSMPSGILGQTLRYGSTSWEATSTVFVKSDGNVGIGEDTPTNKLSVSGNITGSGSLRITGTATSSNYFASNLGIGGLPGGYWNRLVDLSGSGNSAYISRTGNTHAIMAASDTGTPVDTGYDFNYSSRQMVLGTITKDPINFIIQGSSKMFLTNDGKLGIGTTSPASALHIYPQTGIEGLRIVSSNYSPLVISTAAGVDLFRVNQSGDVTAVTSSATRMRSNNYCDANGDNCFDPSSGWSSAGYFATVTTATYSGNNNNNPGYAYAHARCNDQLAGTHVCSAEEILNTIRENKPMPSVNVWIFNGPPGFEAVANDCAARSTNLAAAGGKNQYGSYWQAPASETPLGKGLLMQCNVVLSLACCR